MSDDRYIKVWLLSLILPGRYGRWLTCLVIFAVLYGAFALVGIFDPEHPTSFAPAAALFFCVLLAYIIPIYHYITERSRGELGNLDRALGLGETEREHIGRRLSHKHRAWHGWTTCIGLFSGVAHNLLLANPPGDLLAPFQESAAAAAAFVATMVVWLVMTVALAGLLDNALVFARLARRATVDLLDTTPLTPFARVAVFSTLAVIGAQASFPLLVIDAEASPWTYAPGLIATAGPMLLLITLPVWPIHRAIGKAKRQRLTELNDAVRRTPAADISEPATLAHLNALLAFRREIQQVSEWPFDVGVATRLGLYLIIPPLTWVGAALIENLVESLI